MNVQIKHKILLINDDPASLELMSYILEQVGYKVVSKSNGLEGLETAKKEHPDLIISDIIMPIMDGIEFCRQARLINHLKATPIILVTAYFKGSEKLIEGLDAGADSYIEVPYEPMHLVAKVSRFLERREVEEEYDHFFNFSIDMLCMADTDGCFTKINTAWERTLGFTSQDLLSKSIVEFVHPNDKELASALIRGKRDASFEIRYLCKNGSYKWLLWTLTYIKEKNVIYAVVHDITERKTYEYSLKDSKDEVTNILESITDGFFALDQDWNFTYVNTAAEQLLHRTKKDLLGKNIWKEYPDAVGTFDVMYLQAIKDQRSFRFTEYYPEPLNSWFEVDAFPSKSGISIYFRDITERQQAAHRLVKSETQFKAVFNSSLDGMLIINDESKCLDANPAACALFGLTHEQMTNVYINDYLRDGDKSEFKEKWQLLLEHKIHRGEYILVSSKKSKLNVELASTNTFLPGKHLFVVRDITQRKIIEENLIQSRKRLAEAQELASLGSWEWSSENGITWSDEVYRIFGLNKDEFKVDFQSVIERIHPKDQEYFYSQFRRAFIDGEEFKFKHRIVLPDHSSKTVRQITKVNLDNDGQLHKFVGTIQDITQSEQSEQALRQAEAKYRTLVESSPGIVYLIQHVPPYSLLYVSPNIKTLGFTPEEWYSKPELWKQMIHEEDRDRVVEATKKAIKEGTDCEIEYRVVKKDGTTFWLQNKGRLIRDETGNEVGWQGLMIDVTGTKKLELQIGQSQKLESVGRLAGGIAHDFNNMLMIINGYCDLSLKMIEKDDLLRSNIVEIKKASERSALLTHQLLAFSRQQVLQLKILNLNEVVDDIRNMIERLLGERVSLEIIEDSNLKNVKADLGQITQIIINLTINARDAMPKGGKLSISTSNVCLNEEFAAQHPPTIAGNYTLLKIKDTGTGIDKESLNYIFEPFYTTKELGKGAGLGLATVYGIIKQLGGYIWVDSAIGEGTTFDVYLPQIEQEIPTETDDVNIREDELAGHETVLIAEDDTIVRNLMCQVLEDYGYNVIAARNGIEAYETYKKNHLKIDLLITDIIMPQMDGKELAEKILTDNPNIQILFTSGYIDNDVTRHHLIEENFNFLQKPFTFEELTFKIRKVLNL